MYQTSNGIMSIKEQVYAEKLQQLKSQLSMIHSKTHPDYIQGKALIEQELENRLFCNEISLMLKQKRIEADYESTLAAIQKDFEEKKVEMKEVLMNELEERKRQIEHEYLTMDLNGEGSDIKQPPKRNLRRRFNDPTSANDKKSRKISPSVNTFLSDVEIDEDLAKILANVQKSSGGQMLTSFASFSSSISPTLSNFGVGSPLLVESLSPNKRQYFSDEKREKSVDSLTDDQKLSKDGARSGRILTTAAEQVYQMNGKLFYKKKCFTKGQAVVLTTPGSNKVNAVVQTIGVREVGFRLIGDGNKRLNVPLLHIQQGKYTLKKRAN